MIPPACESPISVDPESKTTEMISFPPEVRIVRIDWLAEAGESS